MSKMAEENEIDFPLINEVFPAEMLEKILQWLDIMSLINARLTCKHWKLIIDNCDIMEKALKKIHCIVIAGGYDEYDVGYDTVEVLTGDLGTKQLPNLPEGIYGSSMVLHNGIILLCGGSNNKQKCLQLDHGTWKEHSSLNKERQ